MSDDPFDASVKTSTPADPWSAIPPLAMVVREVERTIVMEGSSEPPSTLRMQESKILSQFQAVIRASSPTLRTLVALMATISALGLCAALALDGPSGSPMCGLMALVSIAAFPLRAIWLWALARDELAMDVSRFSALSRGVLGPARHEFDVAEIYGFGYQRHRSRPWRYQLVVVMRSGWTAPIDLACTRREELRFVARRLNAELASLQSAR
jgi:hypothetical protein